MRDRAVLGVLAALGLVAAFWFLALNPKRSEVKKLDTEVAAAEQEVAAARGEADQFAKDRLAFPKAYTTMVRLGKAVPADADVPALVVQLEHAAADADVDFRAVKLEAGEGSTSTPAPSTPPPAPATPAPGAGATAGTTGSSGAAAGSTGATGSSASTSGGGTASSPAGAGAATTSTGTAAPAPANATTAAALPVGTEIGDAQLPLMRFSLIFQGSFFKMADLVHNVRALVEQQQKQLLVSGRLLTLDGFTFEQGDSGFPQVKATMRTTAYLLPLTQGLLNGATAQGPAVAGSATPTPVATPASPTTPPAAVVMHP